MVDHQPARGGRIGQLDSLRGVAVVLVMIHHSIQAFHKSTLDVANGLSGWLDLGRMGVVIFFMISGFVIVRAIPGTTPAAARLFWKHRFFRLYPPFWVSILLAIGAAALIDGSACCVFSVPVTPVALLANLTMVPLRFHQPMLLGIYWTLELELFFYVLMTVFALAGRSTFRPMCLTAILLFSAAVGAAAVRVLHFGTSEVGKDQLFMALLHLSLMFSGAALRSHWDAQASKQNFFANMPHLMRAYFGSVALFFLAVMAVKLRHSIEPNTFRVAGTYLGAIAWFLLCLRYFSGSRLGLFVGDRSYGLYLVHLPMLSLVMLAFPADRLSYPVYLLLASAASLAVADLLRRFVERPAIRLAHGRRPFPSASRDLPEPTAPDSGNAARIPPVMGA